MFPAPLVRLKVDASGKIFCRKFRAFSGIEVDIDFVDFWDPFSEVRKFPYIAGTSKLIEKSKIRVVILRVFTTTGTGCSQGVHGCSRVFTTTSTVFANQYYVGFPRISPNDVGCSIATDTPLYNI